MGPLEHANLKQLSVFITRVAKTASYQSLTLGQIKQFHDVILHTPITPQDEEARQILNVITKLESSADQKTQHVHALFGEILESCIPKNQDKKTGPAQPSSNVSMIEALSSKRKIKMLLKNELSQFAKNRTTENIKNLTKLKNLLNGVHGEISEEQKVEITQIIEKYSALMSERKKMAATYCREIIDCVTKAQNMSADAVLIQSPILETLKKQKKQLTNRDITNLIIAVTSSPTNATQRRVNLINENPYQNLIHVGIPNREKLIEFITNNGKKLINLCLFDLDITPEDLHLITQHCPNLKRLALNSPHFNDECVGIIKNGLKHLTHLNLESCATFNDDLAETIANELTTLEFIGLKNTNISDRTVEILASKLSNLQSINLSQTQITDLSLAIICESFKALKEINIAYTKCSEEGIMKMIQELNDLSYLELNGLPISDHTLNQIAKHSKKLQALYLMDCHLITDFGLNLIFEDLPNQLLTLACSNSMDVTDKSVRALIASQKNLVNLTMINCRISPQAIAAITAARKRLTTNFTDCEKMIQSGQIIDKLNQGELTQYTSDFNTSLAISKKLEFIEILKKCGHNLKTLNINYYNMRNNGYLKGETLIAILRLCPNLETMMISSSSQTDLLVTTITQNTNHLKALAFDHCDITGAGLQTALAKFKLDALALNNCRQISNQSIINSVEQLKGCSRLQLTQCNDRISDVALLCIARNLENLQHFNFSGTRMTLRGLWDILVHLNLVSLKIGNCNISYQDLIEIAQNPKSLKTLEIEDCPFINQPLVTMAQQMAVNELEITLHQGTGFHID